MSKVVSFALVLMLQCTGLFVSADKPLPAEELPQVDMSKFPPMPGNDNTHRRTQHTIKTTRGGGTWKDRNRGMWKDRYSKGKGGGMSKSMMKSMKWNKGGMGMKSMMGKGKGKGNGKGKGKGAGK